MLSSELAMLLFSFHDYMAKEEVFAEFMKTGKIQYVAAMNRTEKIEEGKTASKSSDTSDTAIVTFYAIGVVAAVGVAEMIIRNRMDKSN